MGERSRYTLFGEIVEGVKEVKKKYHHKKEVRFSALKEVHKLRYRNKRRGHKRRFK